MECYIGKWFNVEFNDIVRLAKCIDIEFEGGLGPVFLMRTKRGYTFWLTRNEMKEFSGLEK